MINGRQHVIGFIYTYVLFKVDERKQYIVVQTLKDSIIYLTTYNEHPLNKAVSNIVDIVNQHPSAYIAHTH